jgi:hypothetical protein
MPGSLEERSTFFYAVTVFLGRMIGSEWFLWHRALSDAHEWSSRERVTRRLAKNSRLACNIATLCHIRLAKIHMNYAIGHRDGLEHSTNKGRKGQSGVEPTSPKG